jgi:hypothetical protein
MSCTSVGKMIQEKFNEFKGEKKEKPCVYYFGAAILHYTPMSTN